ncbi:hypothetical protein H920_02236 [Fukomys damarensis]|uniref:Uncharacterized protein n=1 Tax=Fukomys damarensis TaxID=885580 RepID=A0A091DZ47_FUKDA|nr:hypothetical protein H920_02236 [Fukomys damarensis]
MGTWATTFLAGGGGCAGRGHRGYQVLPNGPKQAGGRADLGAAFPNLSFLTGAGGVQAAGRRRTLHVEYQGAVEGEEEEETEEDEKDKEKEEEERDRQQEREQEGEEEEEEEEEEQKEEE